MCDTIRLYQGGEQMTIKEIRRTKGIMQYKIAEILGYERAHYNKLENHKCKFKVDTLQKLSVILNVKIEEIDEYVEIKKINKEI